MVVFSKNFKKWQTAMSATYLGSNLAYSLWSVVILGPAMPINRAMKKRHRNMMAVRRN